MSASRRMTLGEHAIAQSRPWHFNVDACLSAIKVELLQFTQNTWSTLSEAMISTNTAAPRPPVVPVIITMFLPGVVVDGICCRKPWLCVSTIDSISCTLLTWAGWSTWSVWNINREANAANAEIVRFLNIMFIGTDLVFDCVELRIACRRVFQIQVTWRLSSKSISECFTNNTTHKHTLVTSMLEKIILISNALIHHIWNGGPYKF